MRKAILVIGMLLALSTTGNVSANGFGIFGWRGGLYFGGGYYGAPYYYGSGYPYTALGGYPIYANWGGYAPYYGNYNGNYPYSYGYMPYSSTYYYPTYYNTIPSVGYMPYSSTYYYPPYYNTTPSSAYVVPEVVYPTHSTLLPPSTSSSTSSRQSGYYDPNGVNMKVYVPNSDAELWFDDVPTKQRGFQRSFHSSNVTKPGTYSVRARWIDSSGQIADQQRQVEVQPGQSVIIDFRY